MSKQKKLIIGVILLAVILMAIGYAGLSSTTLNIDTTAHASANTENFKVVFTGANTKLSNETEKAITVTATEGATNATVVFGSKDNDTLKLDTVGDTAYAILEIKNASQDINASAVNVTATGTDNDIFNFDAIMCDSNGNEIDDYSLASGKTTYVKVSVTLKKSPTDYATATTTVTLTATPAANV